LHAASSAQVRSEGRVVLRRLNRTEYETTLRDLLGPHVEVQDLLPSDNVAAGFDNVSAALDVSSVHLLRYQDAAERALKQVVPREAPQPFRSRLNGREVFEKSKQAQAMNGKSLRIDGDSLILYVRPWNHIAIGTATVPRGGRYRLRASVQAVGTNGRPLPVRFTDGWDWGRSETAVRLVRDAAADQPTVVEAEVELKARELLDVHAWSLPTDRQFSERRAAAKEMRPLDQSDAPALAIHWLELEGPLDEFPPRGYVRLFGDLPLVPPYKNGPLQVVSKQPREDADRLIRAFLPIAFRRPVAPDLQDYYVAIAHRALDRKASFEDALLLAYRAALCSPHFLYLTEPISEAAQLDDHAIAARLSYFFWSTYPDDELLAAAERRELRRPEVLRAQVERLLNDRRAERFTRNFAGQWLDLRQINATTPDPQTYGEFDDFLFWSMPRETTEFFNEILRRDLSVTDFVHSDWTFLNERLAKHYGITDVHGGELRRTALPADSHRGGVLTQASILKVTADGTKTSPVLRGKWVLERIIGQPPPPPPPNVSAIEPDIRGATTIREQLDKHRNTPACASCHKLIDPPGFALESFDVIGGWRDFYRGTVFKREAVVELANYPGRTIVRGPNVESGGQMADGREFKNVDDYKRLLL
ncbi:MAG TPA: DUF1592 domain-containing protein, partial [Pirellulaceae bacterium]|nr:DUF1592 domain-containing protein [Pirellulaceae bacterium]